SVIRRTGTLVTGQQRISTRSLLTAMNMKVSGSRGTGGILPGFCLGNVPCYSKTRRCEISAQRCRVRKCPYVYKLSRMTNPKETHRKEKRRGDLANESNGTCESDKELGGRADAQ